VSRTITDFELPNAGSGPDPLRLSAYAEDADRGAVVVLFQRDYHCGNCRRQVQRIADRYEEFRERRADVVSVLPEPAERAREWQDKYDLPFPLLADADAEAAEAYDQPVRFGAFGAVHDLVGRMPATVVVDARGVEPAIASVERGSRPSDRPDVDELLAMVDAAM